MAELREYAHFLVDVSESLEAHHGVRCRTDSLAEIKPRDKLLLPCFGFASEEEPFMTIV